MPKGTIVRKSLQKSINYTQNSTSYILQTRPKINFPTRTKSNFATWFVILIFSRCYPPFIFPTSWKNCAPGPMMIFNLLERRVSCRSESRDGATRPRWAVVVVVNPLSSRSQLRPLSSVLQPLPPTILHRLDFPRTLLLIGFSRRRTEAEQQERVSHYEERTRSIGQSVRQPSILPCLAASFNTTNRLRERPVSCVLYRAGRAQDAVGFEIIFWPDSGRWVSGAVLSTLSQASRTTTFSRPLALPPSLPPSLTERVKAVQSQLRSEQRALDREMRQIDGATSKAKGQLKMLAKKGDVKSARILAREVVRSEKQKNRLALSKARLNSIGMQLQHQLGEWETRCEVRGGRVGGLAALWKAWMVMGQSQTEAQR